MESFKGGGVYGTSIWLEPPASQPGAAYLESTLYLFVFTARIACAGHFSVRFHLWNPARL